MGSLQHTAATSIPQSDILESDHPGQVAVSSELITATTSILQSDIPKSDPLGQLVSRELIAPTTCTSQPDITESDHPGQASVSSELIATPTSTHQSDTPESDPFNQLPASSELIANVQGGAIWFLFCYKFFLIYLIVKNEDDLKRDGALLPIDDSPIEINSTSCPTNSIPSEVPLQNNPVNETETNDLHLREEDGQALNVEERNDLMVLLNESKDFSVGRTNSFVKHFIKHR
ncbi:hypothetical protein TNIN_335231 [Trichonephila inaurata madagascariensis]|uniref:Uncharacterized protein n=1 Tax=Trichonephila inaurata madagascariensis TaxID=2747483 RepID=A0A8X6JD24_9ARAC|nr:hypothetical protein TNIN_335231 [Trichonephila inaurata madagascariensis]